MAFTFDNKAASAVATTSTTVAVTMTIATGAVICVSVWSVSSLGISTLRDQSNNDFTITANSPANNIVNGSGEFWLAYMLNAPGGSTTITATFNVTGVQTQIQAISFNPSGGTAIFDKDVAPANGSGTAINLPSLTPTNVNSLLYAFASTAGVITSANSPWTLGIIAATTTNADEYDLDVTGAQAVNFTNMTSSAWQAMSMAFAFTATGGYFDKVPSNLIFIKERIEVVGY